MLVGRIQRQIILRESCSDSSVAYVKEIFVHHLSACSQNSTEQKRRDQMRDQSTREKASARQPQLRSLP